MTIYLVLDGTGYPIAAFSTLKAAKAYRDREAAHWRVVELAVKT